MNPTHSPNTVPAVRLAHLSDVHITARPLGWRRPDWFTKRFPGWINYRWLGRAYRFREADEVLAALVTELRARPPNRVIFSGDATALGFEAELIRATLILGVGAPDALPGLAVPGNHDYYTPGVQKSGLFERYFAPWQTGERINAALYPFAQRVGPVWLVAVNSCTGNRALWDAGGSVDAPQLHRLGQLLARLEPGPRILVTHYPVALASGKPERRTHGLRNLGDLVRAAAAGGVCLWLHGHRHGHYYLPSPSFAPFPVICAGSATQHGMWSYNQYIIEGLSFHATRRVYAPGQRRFEEAESFQLQLAAATAEGGSAGP
ncbi:MAG TPA: metallophosphoesterase [Gemmataceae bacterium]|jgi:3',5'-cyclic AMP phosphodiesterase CpdA|nr:metallophosphoesterase [Gemmataceae bacterium]